MKLIDGWAISKQSKCAKASIIYEDDGTRTFILSTFPVGCKIYKIQLRSLIDNKRKTEMRLTISKLSNEVIRLTKTNGIINSYIT